MARKPMLLGATVAGLLVFAVLAAGLFLTRGPAAASPAAAPPTTAAAQSAQAPAAPQDYATRLAQNFAARLGVDQARLDAAFTAAANDTVAQAVRDGKMDQNTADTARNMAARGLTGALQSALNGLGKEADVRAASAPQTAAIEAILPAIAGRLGLNTNQLQDALKQGQSLAALEQAHNVSAAQARDAALAAVRAALDAGAQQGRWSRADADGAYADTSANFDGFLRKLTGGADPSGAAGPLDEAFSAGGLAVARLFGFSAFADLEAALHGGKTFLGLERARNVSEAQVRDTAAAAMRAALAAGVQSGRWTQAEAGAAATEIDAHLDQMLVKIRQAAPVPEAQDAAATVVAQLCGLSLAQLQDALKNGQSVAQVEQAQNVAPDVARTTALAAAHRAIAAGVTAGKWSQEQADDATLVIDRLVDQFLTAPTAGAAPSGK